MMYLVIWRYKLINFNNTLCYVGCSHGHAKGFIEGQLSRCTLAVETVMVTMHAGTILPHYHKHLSVSTTQCHISASRANTLVYTIALDRGK